MTIKQSCKWTRMCFRQKSVKSFWCSSFCLARKSSILFWCAKPRLWITMQQLFFKFIINKSRWSALLSPANALNAQQRHQQQMYMVMQQQQQAQQHRAAMGGSMGPLSPRGQAASGPLSPAALSATIQRVASPHSHVNLSEFSLCWMLNLHWYCVIDYMSPTLKQTCKFNSIIQNF